MQFYGYMMNRLCIYIYIGWWQVPKKVSPEKSCVQLLPESLASDAKKNLCRPHHAPERMLVISVYIYIYEYIMNILCFFYDCTIFAALLLQHVLSTSPYPKAISDEYSLASYECTKTTSNNNQMTMVHLFPLILLDRAWFKLWYPSKSISFSHFSFSFHLDRY